MTTPTKIAPVSSGGGLVAPAPDFVQEHAGEGMGELQHVVRPPRLKIVQKSSRKPFSEMFNVGDVVAVPQMRLVAPYTSGQEVAFSFVPLLMYREWCCWNPLETRGTLKSIRERSLDPKSVVAIKARDERRRASEPCPEMPKSSDGKPLYLKYLEHINYVVMINPPNWLGELQLPVAMTFASGEWQSGSLFSGLLQQRNLKVTPIYATQFVARVLERNGPKGDWHGITVDNPEPDSGVSPWVETRDRMLALKSIHEEFAGALKEQRMSVDYEDEEIEDDVKANTSF